MMDLLSEFTNSLSWRGVLIGVVIFVVTFVVNLAIVSFILVKLPADHFKKNQKTEFWSGSKPALHAAQVIGKNILGVFLIVLGIVLSIPGVPGQGLLTILLGVVLVDFPGKHTLERKLLSRPGIVKTINRLREKFDKPPLEID
jgi:ABC-type phosphate transport system permease subunit